MSSIKQLLIAARKLIENPKNWTKRSFARTRSGKVTYNTHPEACKFCAEGALIRAQRDFAGEVDLAVYALEKHVGLDVYLTHFNDSHTHQEVLNVFDQAIANCSP